MTTHRPEQEKRTRTDMRHLNMRQHAKACLSSVLQTLTVDVNGLFAHTAHSLLNLSMLSFSKLVLGDIDCLHHHDILLHLVRIVKNAFSVVFTAFCVSCIFCVHIFLRNDTLIKNVYGA